MKHSLLRHNQLFTLFLVSKKRASNKNEIVIDVQTVYEINDIRTAEMKSYEEWSSGCEHNTPIRLTQCCTQFKSPGDKILCVLYLHYNMAFTFKWYGIPETKRFIPNGFELGTTLS